MKKFYTVDEYAELKGVNPKEPYRWAKSDKIKELKIASHPKLICEVNGTDAETIAFMNLKGGAGKTTVSVNFAVLLSKLGFKVLVIDTDHQNHCRLFFQEIEYEYSVVDALKNPEKSKDYIYKAISGTAEIDILFSSYDLELFADDFRDDNRLSQVIDNVKADYDFIILDTSPAFNVISRNAAKAANSLIIPLKPEPMHYEGMTHYLGALVMKTQIPKENIKGMVFNLVNEKAAQHNGYMEVLREEYKDFCFESYIPQDVHIPKTVDLLMGIRTNIFYYKEKSRASQSLKQFTWETLRRL